MMCEYVFFIFLFDTFFDVDPLKYTTRMHSMTVKRTLRRCLQGLATEYHSASLSWPRIHCTLRKFSGFPMRPLSISV